MKFQGLLLGSAALLLSAGAASAAHNTPTGWYMSLGAGANWLQDGNIDEYSSTGALDTTNRFDWEPGWVVAGAIGYDFGRNWRVEFEVAYRKNDVDGFCTSSGDCSTASHADIWELSQMVNVMYDISLGGDWEGSLGAGIGGNLVVFDPGFSGNFESDNFGIATDDYTLAGQLIAQIGYRLSERWQAFADYRYMFMDDPDVINPSDQERWIIEKSEHAVMLGIRFDLQRDGSAPPDVRKPKAPKQFIVFFGFNKSNLTSEAQRVVAEAAAAAKEYGTASIAVVGHTDTVGSNDYNLRLSLKRAQAVKDALIALGISDSAISTGGRGEAELMVKTGDGMKEPQNRRATIDLK